MENSKITIIRLAHVHYQHPDLEKALTFLDDFGLEVERQDSGKVYLRGYGVQPYVYVAEQSPDSQRHFLGGFFAVQSYEDLKKAAALPNASQVLESDAPGGGQFVTVPDPCGHLVGFVFGQKLHAPATEDSIPRREKTSMIYNTAVAQPRRGAFRRFTPGPSPVHRLGHYGFRVPRDKFDELLHWYTSIMSLTPTDKIYDSKTGSDINCFCHIDLGSQFVDHHSFFLSAADTPAAYIHHASFEVNDMDTETLGHNWLAKKGWTNCWGVGRHVLGSQIFDYWFDASGNILEHYSDGDLVNKDTEVTREPAAPDSLYIWGPNIPLGFITAKIEDANKSLVAPPNDLKGEPAKFDVRYGVAVA